MAIMLSDNDRAFTIIRDASPGWPQSRRSLTVLPPPRAPSWGQRSWGRGSGSGLHIREAHPSFAVLGRTQEDQVSPGSDTDTVRTGPTKVLKMIL